jgi:hypothetical protein
MKWTIKILINAFLTLIVSNDLLSQNNSIGFTFLDKNLNKGSCYSKYYSVWNSGRP